ncbi:MAG TPA: VOC family protein [Mycobacteriales bacterium]|nr:VOC family protein [Mycobacteriales bacterium]
MTPHSPFPYLRQVVLDCPNPRSLAEFYRELLGYAYRPGHEEDDPDGDDWLVLVAPDGRRLAFQQDEDLIPSTWPEGQVPQQLHLDLTVADKVELDRQHERALALGARLINDESDDEVEQLRAYADPAGHPFCIFVAPDHPG